MMLSPCQNCIRVSGRSMSASHGMPYAYLFIRNAVPTSCIHTYSFHHYLVATSIKFHTQPFNFRNIQKVRIFLLHSLLYLCTVRSIIANFRPECVLCIRLHTAHSNQFRSNHFLFCLGQLPSVFVFCLFGSNLRANFNVKIHTTLPPPNSYKLLAAT